MTTAQAASAPKQTAKKKKEKKKDVFPKSPYTLGNSLSCGDIWTKLSIVVFGLGNLARKQFVKGFTFLAGEIAFIWFMVDSGFDNLSWLPTLGTQTQGKKLVNGFWVYTAGQNSVIILLYAIATLCIIAVFIGWWAMELKSAYKAQVLAKKLGKAPNFRAEWHEMLDDNSQRAIMFLPTLGIALFTVLPLIFMISMAFTSYDNNHPVLFHWVGFANFKTVFSMGGTINIQEFLSVLVWTLLWAFFATFLNFFLGMFFAMIIERKTTRFKGLWRTIFSMSIAVPQIVTLLVMKTMLQPTGAVNRLLESWGWISGPLPFFTNTLWARVTVIVIDLWIGIPYTIMQITGILQNIPAEQYEAAELDGANWWQRFTTVTMPYIWFVMTPYIITTFTGNVNNFNVIYLLSGGAPTPVGQSAGSTDLLITWLYKLTVDQGNYNVGAVIGIFTFIVLATVSLITYRSSGSYKNEEALQ